MEDENFVHRSSFFFFYNFKKKNHLISKFRNSMCDENREGELGGDRIIGEFLDASVVS